MNLLSDVVAKAYVAVIVEMTKKIESNSLDSYYSLWPNEDRAVPPFNLVAKEYYKTVTGKSVLFSRANKGIWVSEAEAIFGDPALHLGEYILDTLREVGIPVVIPPAHVFSALEKAHLVRHVITPSLLR
jgi:hypothetical protein